MYWLQGMYFYDGVRCCLPNLFRKKGSVAPNYPDKPYQLLKDNHEETELEQEERQEKERLIAEAYMKQMIRAGKNWGKKQ